MMVQHRVRGWFAMCSRRPHRASRRRRRDEVGRCCAAWQAREVPDAAPGACPPAVSPARSQRLPHLFRTREPLASLASITCALLRLAARVTRSTVAAAAAQRRTQHLHQTGTRCCPCERQGVLKGRTHTAASRRRRVAQQHQHRSEKRRSGCGRRAARDAAPPLGPGSSSRKRAAACCVRDSSAPGSAARRDGLGRAVFDGQPPPRPPRPPLPRATPRRRSFLPPTCSVPQDVALQVRAPPA
jgi:hypothetical protein